MTVGNEKYPRSLMEIFNSRRVDIGIVGAGAVGGVFSAALMDGLSGEPRIRVSLLVTERHRRPIERDGLRIESEFSEHVYFPDRVTVTPGPLTGSLQIMILAVKADRLESAVTFWKPALADNAWVLSLLNGVDNGETISKLLPDKRVLDGCVYVGARLVRPGCVFWEGGPRRLFCGDIRGAVAGLDEICRLFRLGGVDAQPVHPVAEAVWRKFLFVSPVAVVTSLFACTLRDIGRDQKKMTLFRDLTGELLQQAREEGHFLEGLTVDSIAGVLDGFDEMTTSSLYRDLSRNRRGEFDILVENVLQRSRKRGTDMPLFRRCRDELRARYGLE